MGRKPYNGAVGQEQSFHLAMRRQQTLLHGARHRWRRLPKRHRLPRGQGARRRGRGRLSPARLHTPKHQSTSHQQYYESVHGLSPFVISLLVNSCIVPRRGWLSDRPVGLSPCAHACCSQYQSCQLHTRRSATPAAVVSSVKGAPIRRNSQKPMRTCAPAVSKTITLATEPNRVRFPAKVEVRASSSHRRWGSAPCATHLAATMTYGTFETMFDASTETQEKWMIPRRPAAWNHGKTHLDTTASTRAASRPATMTKSAPKKSSRWPSTCTMI